MNKLFFSVIVALLSFSAAARADWLAFIDQMRGPATSNHVTALDLVVADGARLTNVLTGIALTAGFSVARAGTVSYSTVMSDPDAGTPAHQAFNGFIDFTGSPSGQNGFLLYNSLGAVCTLTFTNLDPARRYHFAATSVRGALYPIRWTACVLQGADAFIEAHTSGCITNGDPRIAPGTITNGQVAFNTGSNSVNGDLIQWRQINPGADGRFSVQMEQWLGAIPGGTAGDSYSYGLTAIRIEEITVISPPTVSLTSPDDNSSVNVTSNVVITAAATAPDGTVTNVAFYTNNVLLANDPASPYSATVSNLPAGIHLLTAVAADNTGLLATSAPVRLVVLPPGNLVGAAGYTNAFSTLPAATAWSTITNGGSAGTITTPAGLDSTVQTNLAAAIRGGLVSGSGNPAAQGVAAVWSSSGFLQTSPLTVGYVSLLGTFVNNSGADAAAVRIRYDLFTNAIVETLPTQGVYYSLTGATGSWTRIPALSFQPGGTPDAVVTLSSPWAYGTRLYLLWADANFSNTDMICQLDNFSLTLVNSLACLITNPPGGASFEQPANIPLGAAAGGLAAITNVSFLTNGVTLGQVIASPYTLVWSNAPLGGHALTAIATDLTGARATSAVVNITVTPPVTNTVPPVLATVVPTRGAVLASLTSIQIIFSESVSNVDAADLRVNGAPATGLSGGGSNFTFTFPQPPLGAVVITWPAGHDILDRGNPPLPFNETGTNATWTYSLVDSTPPVVVAQLPAAGATLSNLTSLQVTFSESMVNVDAADLLVNGAPAVGLGGGGSSYTFAFSPPAPGLVNITWAGGHGLTDVSGNPFNSVGASATWSYSLQSPVVTLIASNSVWRYFKGLSEASSPATAWRATAFNAAAWPTGPAAFFYGADPYTGTVLNDMVNNYTTVFLRQQFIVNSPSALSNLVVKVQVDDGAIVWINNTEVVRLRVGAGEIPFNELASQNAPEQFAGGAVWSTFNLANPQAFLVAGTNTIAIQALNVSLAGSSDFGIDAFVTAELSDPGTLPPTILTLNPPAGTVFALTNITVTFSKPVANVDAADLLVNGVPATGRAGGGASHTFSFASPAYGSVALTWTAGHGITDTNAARLAFNATAPGATWQYTLLNPSTPAVSSQTPPASSTINALTQIQVTFSEPVTNVNAADLLINGVPAGGLTGTNANYNFTFPPPALGNVAVTWAVSHGITDLEIPANAFAASAAGSTWSYTLTDQMPPGVAAQNPPAGASVTNLTSLSVTFSELVTGVNAADLLINGVAATGLGGSGSNYTFTFAQPNTSVLNVGWAAGHGIADAAANPFNAGGVGATWQYFTPDNLPPAGSTISPPPGATVRDLTQVQVTFNEPVLGVNAADLLINSVPATNVTGSAAGPYTFLFSQPVTGAVEIIWAAAPGITDLASPGNAFEGGAWSYVLNPDAVFAAKVLINEIMYLPPTQGTNDEWIELRNIDTVPVNLNGWRFSKGVVFTFPNVTIPAGGHLVIAASTNSFRAKYPAVTNYIGPWLGSLANNGESIRLETALGEIVNEVSFASEGDWAVRQRGLPDGGFRGWVWASAADGFGPTLELINPALPNQHGQNWRVSTAPNGTPGTANSIASTNVPPLVLEVAHFPVVPRSTNPVTVTAKILDERTNGLAVTLFYRNASTVTPPAFSELAMFDDGAHNDGVSNDQVWAATIPVQADKTVLEFYVRAVDADNNTNHWPAVAYAAPDQGRARLTPETSANAVFQVDDTVYAFSQPQYRLTMTEQERQERFASTGNAEFNGTFISSDGTGIEARYNASFRERGNGSRGAEPANQRVNIPTDRRWKGQREFNLNTLYTHAQYAGYLLSRQAGMDAEWAQIVRVYINGTNSASSGLPQFGCYIHVEAPGSEMAAAHWPLDSDGNVYRISSGGHAATLAAHQPPTAANYINLGYVKASNSAENDYSDLTNLTYVLNVVPNATYEAEVRAIVNVDAWLTYFAVNSILENSETSIGSGVGDDSGLYHAFGENKWYFIAHDLDTVLGQGDSGGNTSESIFIAANLASINRFLHWPAFEAAYYAKLRHLCTTVFSPGEVAKTLDEGLGSFTATGNIQAMKQFNTNRVAYILSQLPPDPNALNVAATNLGGGLGANTVLASSNVNYFITGSLTISNGATLTIQPGVNVRLAAGANLTVASGGRLLAEGTAAQPILFSRSGGANWGRIIINGTVGSPESRLAYARLEFNATSTTTPAIEVAAGTAVLDHLTFGNTASPYIHVDGASFVISHCEFPTTTAAFEPVHGTGGIKTGGRGIFYRNWFGRPNGDNDVVDFTGGNRPGSPIVQFLDNVFTGSDDDLLDFDGTDAWVEGNIFLHAHRNGSPDSASAVSGGNDSGNTSEITIIGNIFYDVDQAATAKQGNFYTFLNNTVVHQSGAGFGDAGVTAVLNFADDGTAPARGMWVEGNIFYDLERLTRHVTNGTTVASNTTFIGNLMPLAWAGPGASNSTSPPVFQHVPALAETTNFTNWASAQILRQWLSLQPGSPGLGGGPNGCDQGVIPIGAAVAVGAGATTNDATFTVGLHRTGGVITASGGFPNGSGYTHYRWRLDGGAWSAETAAGTVLNLPGFRSGPHRLDLSGRRDTGTWQDDADYGELALVTSVFNAGAQQVRINEVLASNGSSVPHEGTHPDVIELHNPGGAAVDISGLRLTDNFSNPDRFSFPTGTMIPAGGYLLVYANNEDGTSGLHTGFTLNKDGQSLHLYDAVARGGVLLDTVTFGLQLTDFSVGRFGTNWALCTPTAGGPNLPAATGPAQGLVINEILAAELTAFPDDFVELFNPGAWPVALAGLFFTDNPAHWPDRSPVPALTYLAAGGYLAFRADGRTNLGAGHLNFSLGAERGLVALLHPDYSVIDCVLYGPQRTDVSQGRVVNNVYDNNFFTTPTPGAPNPGIISTNSGVVLNEILAANSTITELDGSTPDWIELYNLGATNLDLGDYSLSDDSLLPRKYVFAPGTIIVGHSYLRLRCDGSLPTSSTNTGFNLKAEGGSVYLFDRPVGGGALLNAVTYGLQAVDFSISRVPNGTGVWALTLPTPGGASLLAATANTALVKVNEWMANPAAGEDWFELWNPNNQPVAVGGYFTTDDLNNRTKSPIPALSFLGASTNGYQRFWADSLPASGANHVSFKLNNDAAGESVGFANPSGTLVDSISYVAPAAGVSEGRFPDGSATIALFPGTGSPGDANYLLLTSVVINEALSHTDPPLEDAIELRNLTAAPVDISHWWLSDAKNSLRKYRITNGVTIPPHGYVVFYEHQFNRDPSNNVRAFSLSSAKDDDISLSTGDTNGNLTGYRTTVNFGAGANGVSFGRHVTSDQRQEFVALSARSFGQDDPGTLAEFRTGTGLANPYPKVGPVVISRIMYHPPDIGTNDNTLDEYLELKNITGATVPLFDPAAATNTWRLRDAVDFNFPPGVSLPAGGQLVLVSFDPVNNPGQLAAFRGLYGLAAGVPVHGPYTGKLANNDDRVELSRPESPNLGDVPYLLVDRAHYRDLLPWPSEADGTGLALQRVSLTGFGNDPTNWLAVAATFGGVVDTDGDGLPNAWELAYNLNPNSALDANLDGDGDGLTNLQEYFAGTSPLDPSSTLRVQAASTGLAGATNAVLHFEGVAGKSYTIQFTPALPGGWSNLASTGPLPASGTRWFTNQLPSGTPQRFYRVLTP